MAERERGTLPRSPEPLWGGSARRPAPRSDVPLHRETAADPARRISLLGAVAQAAEVLTGNADLSSALAQAIRVLGEATGVDRVNVFRFDHAEQAGFLFAQWFTDEVQPASAISPGPFAYADYEEVWRPLMAGEVYHSPTHAKTGANAALNARSAVVTDMHVPVIVDGCFWGTLSFDGCPAERSWSDGEIEVLRAAAATVAAAVRRDHLERERERASRVRVEEAERLGRLLRGVVAASRALLDEPELPEGLRRWCGHLASAMGADRAGVGRFLDEPGHALPRPVNYLEWARPGLEPLDGIAMPRTADFDAWSRRLALGEVIWATRDELAEPASRVFWDGISCHSNYIVPVMVDGSAWGWLYLDFETPRERRDADVPVLRTAAEGAASAILRDRAARASLRDRVLKAALQASHALLASGDFWGELPDALGLIARAADMDRLGLLLEGPIEGGGRVGHRVVSMWNAPGVPRHDELGLVEQANDDFPALATRLHAGEPYWLHLEDMADGGKKNFERLGIRTTTGFPVFVDGRYAGFLGFDDCRNRREYRAHEAEALSAAASVVAAALHREQLVDQVRRERERAALERVAEMARANDALQATTDALASAEGLDEIVPIVLHIAARTFGSKSAGFYEHGPDDMVYLRYWLHEGRVLTPAELLALDEVGDHATPRRLAAGFTVPQGYLGARPSGRTRAVWIDHSAGTVEPEFDDWTLRQDLVQELNIPCIVGGEARHALVIYRGAGTTYTQDEVALAEALAKQLALAVQTARLAAEARDHAVEHAVAREREEAAQLRAADLVRRNALLQTATEASRVLIDAPRLNEACARVLAMLGTTLGVHRAALGILTPVDDTFWCELEHEWTAPGVPRQQDDPALRRTRLAGDPEMTGRFRRGEPVQGAVDDHPEPSRSEQRAAGVRSQFALPVMVDGEPWGVLGFDDCARVRAWDEGEIAFLRVVAAAVAAAVQRERAEHALREAVAAEREGAARERAGQLAKANDALQRTAARLVAERDLDGFLEQTLVEVAAQLGSSAAVITPYDAASDTLRIAALVQGGVAVPPDPMAPRIPARDAGFLGALLGGDPYKLFDTERDADLFWPGAVDFLRAGGMRYALAFAVRVGDRLLGQLSVAYASEPHLASEQVTLVQALSNQAALAIEVTQLAAEARAAAVAREREQAERDRAAELARANQALRRGVERLSVDRSLESMVGAFLAEAVAAVGARGGAVMLRVPGSATTFRPEAIIQGHILSRREIDADPYLGAYVELSAEDPGGIFGSLASGGTPSIRVDDLRDVFPQAHAYHSAFGDRIIWHAPLLLNGEVLGFTGLAITSEVLPSEAARETVAALAQQLVLALELTRLAEEAREAAVAREREVAAQQRAAELARANAVLSDAVLATAESSDFEAVLGRTVASMAEVSGASYGTLFRYDVKDNTLASAFWVEDGVLHAGFDPGAAPLLRAPFDADVTPAFRAHVAARDVMAADLLDLEDEVRAAAWPGVLDWHLAHGRRCACAIPVMAGTQPLGMVGLGWRETVTFTAPQRQLLLTLASQAALVMRLDHLASATRAAAVAREQEAAAQQRATELAHANQVLQRTVGRLADVPDASAFYSVALGEMAVALSAGSAALMMFDPARGTFRVTCSVLDGVEQPLRGIAHDRDWSLDDPVVARAWDAIQRADPVLQAEIDGPYVHPDTRAWHHGRGDTACLFLPLYRGAKPLGFAGFGVRSRTRATRVQGELARALAQQLALALELDRLGEQGRHAAVLEERTRLAREIHDTLAHGLAGIAVTLEGARGILPRDSEQGLAHVDTALALARESLAEARCALHALRPLAHAPVGLGVALQQLAARFNGHNGTAVRVEAPETPLPLAEEAEVELLRIAQEAVSNAVRHARARTARVSLSTSPAGEVTLCVSDDGRGFDPGALEPAQMVGITGMRERAARLGGALRVWSRLGEGTGVTVLVPLRPERRTTEPQP